LPSRPIRARPIHRATPSHTSRDVEPSFGSVPDNEDGNGGGGGVGRGATRAGRHADACRRVAHNNHPKPNALMR
jgi:hypothetical protein